MVAHPGAQVAVAWHTIIGVAFIFLLATFTHAQSSQFLFDANGNLAVRMPDFIAPPQITGQPQMQVVATNQPAAFAVVVGDERLLTYQWRFNGTNLAGETKVSLLLDNVSTNNEGPYNVVLINPSGSVTSAPAMLWIDNDRDGMGDSWELTYFGNLNQSPNSNFDGDGATDLREFLDRTDPTDSNSVRFQITVVRDGGSVVITPDQPNYTNGQRVTLTAIGSTNEPFHAWLGDLLTHSNSVTLVVTNHKTVYARFTPIDFVWTNITSGDWNSPANWTPNLVPGSNDNVTITANGGDFTVTLNTSADCADLSLTS